MFAVKDNKITTIEKLLELGADVDEHTKVKCQLKFDKSIISFFPILSRLGRTKCTTYRIDVWKRRYD